VYPIHVSEDLPFHLDKNRSILCANDEVEKSDSDATLELKHYTSLEFYLRQRVARALIHSTVHKSKCMHLRVHYTEYPVPSPRNFNKHRPKKDMTLSEPLLELWQKMCEQMFVSVRLYPSFTQ
jgi:hypothetical protein